MKSERLTPSRPSPEVEGGDGGGGGGGRDVEIARLREELRTSIEHRQSAVERLEAANEELRTLSDEVRARNALDVEERKRALGVAEEAGDFTTAIVEAGRDPLLILDGAMRVEMASASFYETFRARKTETEGRLIYALGNGQWAVPRLRQLLEEVLPKAARFADVEVEHDFEAIGRKVMRLHGRRIVFPSGRSPRILLVIEDVTERKDREARDRLLGEVSPALASSLDSAGVLAALAELSVPRFADLCIVDALGVDGSLPRAAAAPADWALRLGIPEALDAPQPPGAALTGTSELYPSLSPAELEVLARTPGRAAVLRERGIRSAMVVPLGVRGRTLGAITFCRAAPSSPYGRPDVAWAEEWARRAAFAVENARLFGEAQEAIRSRERFLSIASHEMKTPLTALDLQVRLLLLGQHPDPCPLAPLRKSFEMLGRQTAKFSKLIDQLLDLARIESGKLEFEDAEVDLATLCRDVVARFAEGLARSGSTLELHAAAPVLGRFDGLRLDQVATNLISNAVKYGQGKPIAVRVEAEGGLARLVVRDGGIGIAKADHAKIFEKLERTVQARCYGGLGLGLYITRRIVEHYGGATRVESELGRGSAFTVDLPLARRAEPAGASVSG